MEKIKLSEFTKYEQNPFTIYLRDKMYLQPRANTIIAKGEEIINTKTGEVMADDILIGRRKIVDKSEFVKIYANEIATLFNLSKKAINVFVYLAKVMDYNNRAYFNYVRDCEKVGYNTHVSTLQGIKELLKNDIIALDVREHTYWLNPAIICKGERFAKYTEYVTFERDQRDREMKKQYKERVLNAMAPEVEDKLNFMGEEVQRRYERGEKVEDIYSGKKSDF